jgi:hypothetical protein
MAFSEHAFQSDARPTGRPVNQPFDSIRDLGRTPFKTKEWPVRELVL